MVRISKKILPSLYEGVNSYNIICEDEFFKTIEEEIEWIEKGILFSYSKNQVLCVVIENLRLKHLNHTFIKHSIKKNRFVGVSKIDRSFISFLHSLRDIETDFLIMPYNNQILDEVLLSIQKKTRVQPVVLNQWKHLFKNVLMYFSHFDYFIYYEVINDNNRQ